MSRRFAVKSAICFCAIILISSRPHGDQTARPAARLANRSTADGHPDLQGIWTNKFATPLQRPKELEGVPLLTDAQVAELNRRSERNFKDGRVMVVPSERSLTTLLDDPSRFDSAPTYDPGFFTEMEFENRTSLITDPPNGRLPEYTRAGLQRRDAKAPAVNGVEDLPLATRCLSFGFPRIAGVSGTPSAGIYAYYQIVQTRDYVVFFMEAIHEARVIPLDGRPHAPSSMRSWNGDSRGRWDGDALVIDTTNFRRDDNFLGAGEHLHLIERLRRVAADELQYEVRVEDPTTWVRPWTAMVRLKATNEQIYEFACHEGNALTMEGILAPIRNKQ